MYSVILGKVPLHMPVGYLRFAAVLSPESSPRGRCGVIPFNGLVSAGRGRRTRKTIRHFMSAPRF